MLPGGTEGEKVELGGGKGSQKQKGEQVSDEKGHGSGVLETR